MTHPISRRHFTIRALQAGAAGTVLTRAQPGHSHEKGVATGVVRIHWEPAGRSWPARPATTASRIVFISTADVAAPRPPDFDLERGDVWWRHPDCLRLYGVSGASQ